MSKIARRWARRLTLAGIGATLALAAMAAADSDPAWADDRPVPALVERVGDVVERVAPTTPPADLRDKDEPDQGDDRPDPDCPDPAPSSPPTSAPDREPRPEPTPGRDDQPAPSEPAEQPTPTPTPSRPADEPTQRPTPTPPTPTPSPPVIDLPPVVVDIPPVAVPPIVVDVPPIVITPTPPAEQPPVEQPPTETPPPPAWPIPIPLPGQGTTPTAPAAPVADHPAADIADERLVEHNRDDDRAVAADTRLCPSRQRASGPPRTVRPAPPRTDVDRRPDGCPGDGHTVWEPAPQSGGVHQPRGSTESPVDITRQAAVAGPPAGHLAVAGARAHLPLGRTTHLDPRPA